MKLTWSSAPKFRELMCGLLKARNKANLAQTTAHLSWPFRLLTFLSCLLVFMSSYGCSMHPLALHPSMAGSDWHIRVRRQISFPCGLVLEIWWQRDIILSCISLTIYFVFPSRSFEKIHFYLPTFLLQSSFSIFFWAKRHDQIFLCHQINKSGAYRSKKTFLIN